MISQEMIMGKQPIPIPNPPNVSCGIGVKFKQSMVKSLGVVYTEIRTPPQKYAREDQANP